MKFATHTKWDSSTIISSLNKPLHKPERNMIDRRATSIPRIRSDRENLSQEVKYRNVIFDTSPYP